MGREVALVKRILLVLAVALVMAAMMAVTVSSAFAFPGLGPGNPGFGQDKHPNKTCHPYPPGQPTCVPL